VSGDLIALPNLLWVELVVAVADRAITRRWNTSRKSPQAVMIAADTRRRVAFIILGAFDEEKAPATYGRHIATSVRWLRISVRLREGCKGERSADNPARETF